MERVLAIGALTAISAFVVISGLSVPIPEAGLPKAMVAIKKTQLVAEVASTDIALAQGLSGRSLLPEGHGMLFVFDSPGRYAIWMKDMRFSIDVLWLDRFGRVSYIVESAMPETSPNPFVPPEDARYVLETRAGFVQHEGIQKGDWVSIPDPW